MPDRAPLLRYLPLLLAALVLLAFPSARAQQPSPQDLEQGKEFFERGLQLYKEKAFAQALGQFERAYALTRRPSALRNVGQCYRDMNQFAAAHDAYERLIAAHGPQLPPADASAVRRALNDLAALTIALQINVNEAGAAVELDGHPVGTSPAPPKRVDPGSHALKVTKAGFLPVEMKVEAKPGDAGQTVTVPVSLQRESTTGHLTVREQNGRQVHVLVDQVDRGFAPWEGDLPPGDHKVQVRGDKTESGTRTVTLAKGERFDLVLDAASLQAHVRITTLPASATITFDGKEMGTGSWEADVDPGDHTVEVALAGYPSAVRKVTLQRGQELVQEIPLAGAVGAPTGPEYKGAYARFAPFWAFWTNVPSYVYNALPNEPNVPSESGGFPLGFGATINVGYNVLDPIGIEFVGAFMLNHFSDTVTFPDSSHATAPTPTPYKMDLSITSLNFFLGVGGRLTSKGETVRFTGGLAPGIAIRKFMFNRSGDQNQTCNGNCDFSAGPGYVAPALKLDGGMLVGNTPGAKFFLGVHAWLDIAPTVTAGPDTSAPLDYHYFDYDPLHPSRGWVLAHGPQFYLGPTIGVQFGH